MREADGNSCVQGSLRAFSERLCRVPDYGALEVMAAALREFRRRNKGGRPVERKPQTNPSLTGGGFWGKRAGDS